MYNSFETRAKKSSNHVLFARPLRKMVRRFLRRSSSGHPLTVFCRSFPAETKGVTMWGGKKGYIHTHHPLVSPLRGGGLRGRHPSVPSSFSLVFRGAPPLQCSTTVRAVGPILRLVPATDQQEILLNPTNLTGNSRVSRWRDPFNREKRDAPWRDDDDDDVVVPLSMLSDFAAGEWSCSVGEP